MFGLTYSQDPTVLLSNFELQKSQVEREVTAARQKLEQAERAYKIIEGQIAAIKSQMAPLQAQVPAANPLEHALKARGLTPNQLQAALDSPDGRALNEMYESELMRIIQAGTHPAAN